MIKHPLFEDRIAARAPRLPRGIMVTFGDREQPSLAGSEAAIETYEAEGVGVIAILCVSITTGLPMALHVEQSPDDFRALAAAALRAADALDGGKSVQ